MVIHSEHFAAIDKSSLNLRVFLGAESYTLIAFDQDSSEVLAVEKIAANIPSQFAEFSFKQVEVLCSESVNSFLPDNLFEEQNKEKLLSLVVEVESNDSVRVDRLEEINSVNLWKLPLQMESLMIKQWPNCSFGHLSSFLLARILYMPKGLYAVKSDNQFLIIALDNGKILGVNSYKVKDNHDVLYFLSLFVHDIIDLPEEIWFEGESDLEILLLKYFVRVNSFRKLSINEAIISSIKYSVNTIL